MTHTPHNQHSTHTSDASSSHHEHETPKKRRARGDYILPMSILASATIIAGAWIYTNGLRTLTEQGFDTTQNSDSAQVQIAELEEKVFPSKGVVLPVQWKDIGSKLVDTGVIDADKFVALYEQRGAFPEEYKNLLFEKDNNKLVITRENSGYVLNLLWALGLGSKNKILETGEMMSPQYGGNPGGFASTGGWTIAQGDPMNHYSKHTFFNLTPEQQGLVERISRGIYRPCCNNSTHFPDCNHGMAMLGLLQLMASQGMSEQEMWNTALVVNSYWFPDTYITIASYMKDKGIDWKNVDSQMVLGADYSSASGYRNIASQVTQPASASQGGSGCDVGGGTPVQQRQQNGCGI